MNNLTLIETKKVEKFKFCDAILYYQKNMIYLCN